MALEYTIGIMSGCLPCLRPLMTMLFPVWFAPPNADEIEHASNSGGSWPKTSFSAKNMNSIRRLPSQPENNEAYKLSGRNNTGSTSWAVRVESPSNVETDFRGIKVSRDITVHERTVRQGKDPWPADGSSEEWIIRPDVR